MRETSERPTSGSPDETAQAVSAPAGPTGTARERSQHGGGVPAETPATAGESTARLTAVWRADSGGTTLQTGTARGRDARVPAGGAPGVR
jgi:hypothetical protein